MSWFTILVLQLWTLIRYSAGTGSSLSISKSNEKGRRYQRGELMFADEFRTFDLETWTHEKTFASTGWEFQMYRNSREVSYVRDGILYIKPQLTSEMFGEHSVQQGQMSLHGPYPEDACTNTADYGCERSAGFPLIINPVVSAKIRTVDSFYFTYGRVEIRAKLPAGDWMWPQISLGPRFMTYGPEWPRSGNIILMESRGNQKFVNPATGEDVGSSTVVSGLHFGWLWNQDGWDHAHVVKKSERGKGFDADFHVYGLIWSNENITFTLDGIHTRTVVAPQDAGFTGLGGIPATVENPWQSAENPRMAPFDQKMYLAIKVAVGGVSDYFPDHFENGKGPKPWRTKSDRASFDFYNGRDQWYPSWEGSSGAFQIDYVRVYAI